MVKKQYCVISNRHFIKTEDISKDITKNVETRFHTSNYE